MERKYFEEAFVNHINSYVSLEELKEIRDKEPAVFNSNYYNDLYCPDCLQAQLELAFGEERRYLRAYDVNQHKEDCPYFSNVGMATTEQINEHMKSISPQTRENNLWKLISYLNCDQKVSGIKTTEEPTENGFTFIPKHGTAKRVYIPRQRLKNENNFFDYDVYKCYYGNVFLEVDKKYLETMGNIQFRLYTFQNNTKCKPICSIFLKGEVLHSPIINTENGIYYIAFFGKMIQKDIYNNLYINNKHDIICVPYVHK